MAPPDPSPTATSPGTPTLTQEPTLGVMSIPVLPPASEPITVTLPDGTPISTWRFSCPQAEYDNDVPVYTYEILQEYPHDPSAYTQGLVYDQGRLLESTGLYGESSLRRVDLDTGEVLQIHDLAEQYFGEGLAQVGDKLYQLTYKENNGFVYDAESFEPAGQFFYPVEGWGLAYDGTNLLMSDGSSTIYFLDPQSLEFTGSLDVISEFGPVRQINELEYINGEIWANIFSSSCIVRIDPASGVVIGWIGFWGSCVDSMREL